MKHIPLIIIFEIFFFVGTTFSQSSSLKLGYGFSPQGQPNDYSQMGAFLEEVANTCNGGVILANGSWRDSFASSGNIPAFQNDICKLQPLPYAYTDMVVFSWGTPTKPYTLFLDVPGDTARKWTNSTAKNLFLKMLLNVADSLQPTYFFIGNEISMYWEDDSVDFMGWVAFYHQAYDSIKLHSPSSKVGTVFNYEHLSGNGSLIGWTKSYWNSLDAFDTSKIDILGLTVYPFFNYSTANAVPTDYLTPIFSKMENKPIAITETGWQADSILANWFCSPGMQVDYINKLFTIIKGQNVEVINWLFLNYLMDQSTSENQLACSIALRDPNGNDLPALSVWLSHCSNSTVSMNSGTNNGTIIFPNPFFIQTTLQTEIFLRNANIILYNSFGQKVKQIYNISGQSITLSRDNLHSGVYFLRLMQDNQVISTNRLIIID